jgi:peptidyl-prolyl cis-trans isomerase C
MTLDELKQRLIEMYAPEQIIRFEVVGRLAVSDAEMHEYYESHPQVSEKPGKATVREIVLLAEGDARDARRAEAQQLRERAAAAGADFAQIATESSESATKSSGGLLGSVTQGDLAPELEAFVFQGAVGEVSPVIEMPHGFHILKVDERTDARKTPEAEMKEDLRKAVEQDKYAAALAAYLQKARAESEVIVNDRYKDRASSTKKKR